MILCGLVFNSYVAENRIRPTYFYFTLVSHRITWSRVNRDLKLINGSVIIHQNQLIYKDQSTKNISVNLLQSVEMAFLFRKKLWATFTYKNNEK